ncbi:MAG TPA: CsgG/HfaB family protein [Phycisphaerae bacterium]|nr:hypothetical protein [Phycisphaerae bacterium]HOI56199.1 CsgG/HfaB family protein [Phycisphaerae bacterium]
MTRSSSIVVLGFLASWTSVVAAQEAGAPNHAAPAAAAPAMRTVAVLGYEAKWIEDPSRRKEASDILATVVGDRLSAMDEVVAVERADIEKLLKEQTLNLSGLVDENNRVRIGKLLGAQFLLWGSGFKLGEQIYVTTKVINVETGQFKGIIAKMPADRDLAAVVEGVSDELIKALPAAVKALSPEKAPEVGPVEMLKRQLGGDAKAWLVAADEEHKGPPVIDPAIRNELEALLSGAGQSLRSLDKKDARSVLDGRRTVRDVLPDAKADYYVLAEGFSEFGKRLSQDLVVCVARVEMKLVDAATGNVLAAGSADARATDLGEHLAAKQALRKATRTLLLELAAKLPPNQAGDAGDRQPK